MLDMISAQLAVLQESVIHLQQSVDHIDTGVHGVRQFIDEHLPLIRRFTDPGAAVRGFLPGAKNAKRKQP